MFEPKWMKDTVDSTGLKVGEIITEVIHATAKAHRVDPQELANLLRDANIGRHFGREYGNVTNQLLKSCVATAKNMKEDE